MVMVLMKASALMVSSASSVLFGEKPAWTRRRLLVPSPFVV